MPDVRQSGIAASVDFWRLSLVTGGSRGRLTTPDWDVSFWTLRATRSVLTKLQHYQEFGCSSDSRFLLHSGSDVWASTRPPFCTGEPKRGSACSSCRLAGLEGWCSYLRLTPRAQSFSNPYSGLNINACGLWFLLRQTRRHAKLSVKMDLGI